MYNPENIDGSKVFAHYVNYLYPFIIDEILSANWYIIFYWPRFN